MPNMEQKWNKIWQSCQVQTLKTCRKSTVQHASLAVKLRVTPVAPPWGLCLVSSAPMSLDRPRMGAMKSETHRLQEVLRTKFHEISSKPRGSTVRWLLWRWPCQAKSDPPRCTASGLSQMPAPCGNTSSQANLPSISCSEPTTFRFSVPASKTKNDHDKNSPNFDQTNAAWKAAYLSHLRILRPWGQVSQVSNIDRRRRRTWAWNSW